MPQKVNPVVSEAVFGMSIAARHKLLGLLVAMQGVHERSAGEWQVEWDSLPSLFTLTAGCLRHTTAVLEHLEVHPDRMRANLDADGGALMAEAMMMALAPHIGRLSAHELVGEACRTARASNATLGLTLMEMLDDDLREALPPLMEVLDPDSYLGEAEAAIEMARKDWRLLKADIVPDWKLDKERTVRGRSWILLTTTGS
jgi:3-carboxy-cis,cis-muconate cycloisomerase